MNKRDTVIEKFKVLLASIFPVEEVVEVPEVLEAEVEVPIEVEVKLEEVTLEDGTIISFETLTVDQPINVVNEDGTLAPLADGEYIINEMKVVCTGGVITEVTEEPKEAEEVVEVVPPVEMSAEPTEDDIEDLINGKVEEIKLAYEEKLAKQKADFDAQIEELGNKFKETEVIQAPVEVEKTPKTYKEMLFAEIQEKRSGNVY